MAKDDSTLEGLIEDQIATVLESGQRYSIRGREFVRANLKDLLAAKMQLERQASRNANGMFTVARINPPS